MKTREIISCHPAKLYYEIQKKKTNNQQVGIKGSGSTSEVQGHDDHGTWTSPSLNIFFTDTVVKWQDVNLGSPLYITFIWIIIGGIPT